MGFKKIQPPSIYETSNIFYEKYLKNPSYDKNPTKEWKKFLDICGLDHISMSRLEVVDKQKWFLAKIKYEF